MSRGRRGVWSRALVAWLLVALTLVAAEPVAAAGPADDGSRPGEPDLSVDPAAVHRAMTCRGPADGGGREPVLLVPGTFFTAGESFGLGYLPALAARGLRVCTVDLPNRSVDDIQAAAEHVVVAVHRLARESGRKVDVLGHSQGALQPRWAVKWWPSVRAEVDDLVSLAGPNQGTTMAGGPLIPLLGCAACVQMASGSAFLTALNSSDQTPGQVSYTAVYSTLVDELITPNATAARIEGASNIELQALCPARVVTHVSILADAVGFALVLDALGSPGPASPARFDRALCVQSTSFGGPGALSGLPPLLVLPRPPAPGGVPAVEPPLRPYARPTSAPPPLTPTTTTRPTARTAVTLRAPPVQASATLGGPPPAGATVPPPAPGPQVGAAALAVQGTAARRSARPDAVPVLALLALALGAGALGGVAARRSRLGPSAD